MREGGYCTDESTCGVFAWPLGPDCFRLEASAPSSEECPGQGLALYVDHGSRALVVDHLPGYCRSDGVCGLDTSGSWGAGCVARADIARAAAATCNPWNEDLADLQTTECGVER